MLPASQVEKQVGGVPPVASELLAGPVDLLALVVDADFSEDRLATAPRARGHSRRCRCEIVPFLRHQPMPSNTEYRQGPLPVTR